MCFLNQIYFNSTMVRLKAGETAPMYIFVPWFQFHYGTIKRQLQSHDKARPILFQFHYGTIKSG